MDISSQDLEGPWHLESK